ncbi:integrase domain-containing protein [Hydrocarboniphaga sp.]|uniref:integrase domain-containing protein n=1 Tax=Hydrocarboniphaga sp. TaxID=2033016 RepID=UPI002626F514|nr:integrase domain-containing protein [Hydrocarboniphaga sp.]
MELQRALGLRETEAIRGGRADILARWERELKRDRAVRVVEGTKGGRERTVKPADQVRALKAVERARSILREQKTSHLIVRADGTSASGLKQARGIYRNLCHRENVLSHAARYEFAQERVQAYRDEGNSEREARAATSLSLGHGDGRGTSVASVYARKA